jgi:hypothetical protein
MRCTDPQCRAWRCDDITTLSQEEQDWLTEHGFDTLQSGDFYLTKARLRDGIQIENDNTLPFSQQPFVLPPGKALDEEGIFCFIWTSGSGTSPRSKIRPFAKWRWADPIRPRACKPSGRLCWQRLVSRAIRSAALTISRPGRRQARAG